MKKYLIMALCVCAAFGISACGTKKTDDAPAETTAATTTAAEKETETTTEAADEAPEETAAPAEEAEFDIKTSQRFELTSADLHDGVWDTVITNTEFGSNVSPQLSWQAVEGAQVYAIYMVDTTAQNWIHWKSNDVTETDLKQGWADNSEYVGPYPPGGTHDYEIYVFALKKPVERLKGAVNSDSAKFRDFIKDIDAEDPDGNIISYGHIVGTYTHGDK